MKEKILPNHFDRFLFEFAMAFHGWNGLSSPILRLPASTQDQLLLASLKQYLVDQNVIESEAEEFHRIQVMAELDSLAKSWIRELCYQRGFGENQLDSVGGRVQAFGSYRLGVHSKGGDIDALLLAPKSVERSDFFTSFVDRLKRHERVTDLRVVDNAFVPVIKMYFDGVEIDLTFARLMFKEVSEGLNLKENEVLRLMEMKCIRSLNGCRVTDEILALVPDKATFREALRAIKLWAKRRGIYSNVLGFLGGVSWALLVAFICQKLPNASAAQILRFLFLTFSKWKWPQPVLLKIPENPQGLDIGGITLWDPRTTHNDRTHLMPIITPSYPHQNSTYNVSRSALKIMTGEFRRGEKIMSDLLKCENPSDPTVWTKLFEPLNFFSMYKNFIRVMAFANTPEDLKTWKGCVESRLRHLINQLEQNDYLSTVHVLPRDYPVKPEPGHNYVGVQWFVGLHLEAEKEKQKSAGKGKINLNLTPDVNTFLNTVRSYGQYSGTMEEGMDVAAKHCLRSQLLDYLPQSAIKESKILALLAEHNSSRPRKPPIPPPINGAPRTGPPIPANRPKTLRRDSSQESVTSGGGLRAKRMRTTSSSSDLNLSAPVDIQPLSGTATSPSPLVRPPENFVQTPTREKTPLSQRSDDSGLGLPIQDSVISEDISSPKRQEADSTGSPVAETSNDSTGKKILESTENFDGFSEPPAKLFRLDSTE